MSTDITIPDQTIAQSFDIAKAKELYSNIDINPNTRDDYQARIGLFFDWLTTHPFGRNTYLDYKRYLADKTDFSVSTKNKYLIAARVLLRELHKLGVLPADITVNVKGFAQDKKHKRNGLNEAEMTRLIDYLATLDDSPKTARIKAICTLLALQGLRQIEITRLDVTDLDLTRGRIFVQGKGRDDKEPVYLHPHTTEAIKHYLRANKKADGALFTSNSPNSRDQRLTTRAIRLIVKNTLIAAGVDNTTHGFRHYFTTQLVKHYEGNLLAVARYTRHRNLEMLQVYNDEISQEADLPKYYEAFNGVKLWPLPSERLKLYR